MRGRQPRQCLVIDLRDTMTEEEQKSLDSMLASTLSFERMSVALRNHGYVISYQTLRRHVNKLCGCI